MKKIPLHNYRGKYISVENLILSVTTKYFQNKSVDLQHLHGKIYYLFS